MKTLVYKGPQDAVNVAGVGRVAVGQEFSVDDDRAVELLAKKKQQFQEAAPDFTALSVAQLKDALSKKGIPFDANAKKADLIALLSGEGREA